MPRTSLIEETTVLRQQAAKAFDNFNVQATTGDDPFTDRLIVEKLPLSLTIVAINEIGDAVVDHARKLFQIPEDDIWVHARRCDPRQGWTMEIRSDDPLPHYRLQPVVRDIVAEKLAAFEAEQAAAQEQKSQAVEPLALRM